MTVQADLRKICPTLCSRKFLWHILNKYVFCHLGPRAWDKAYNYNPLCPARREKGKWKDPESGRTFLPFCEGTTWDRSFGCSTGSLNCVVREWIMALQVILCPSGKFGKNRRKRGRTTLSRLAPRAEPSRAERRSRLRFAQGRCGVRSNWFDLVYLLAPMLVG